MPTALPPNLEQVSRVESVNGDEFKLKDERIIIANALIYCTGYRFTFPFLHESCKITVKENHVTPLYKHLINIEHPKMAAIGIPARVIPFPLFHIQVRSFFLTTFNTLN